jgi:hypothetical protein
MSLTTQVLVLVLSFPAAGLLLYALTIEEMWMLRDPAGGQRRQRVEHAEGRTPPERQTVIFSLADRQRERAASFAAPDREGEANPAVTARPSGRTHSGVRLARRAARASVIPKATRVDSARR